MEKELDPVVIKATQTSLGKYVKRPPLTEKLLKKPPFRFLHDIVTTVLKTTGFFEGLFNDEELISENVKDRESKLLFLNKVITVVGLTVGKTLPVKSSKIIAGQEPDKTNELLQCLAEALDKKLSSAEAIQKYKDGIKLPTKKDEKKSKETTKPTKPPEPNKLTSKSSEKLSTNKKESNIRAVKQAQNEQDKTTSSKTKSKDKTIHKSETQAKKNVKSITKKPSVDKNMPQDGDSNTELSNIISVNETDQSISKIEAVPEVPKKTEEMIKNSSLNINEENSIELNGHDLNSSYTIADNLNSSSSSQDLIERERDKYVIGLGGETDVREEESTGIQENVKVVQNNSNPEVPLDIEKIPPASEDSKTENRRGTLIKSESQQEFTPTHEKNLVRPLSVRPSSSRPGAPRLREKLENILSESDNILVGKVNIIVENTTTEEEEDTSIIIIDQETNASKTEKDEQEPLQGSLNQHGHLVQQILESQKEYSQLSGKTEIEWEFGAQKARDAINKEIEQLRFNIQALSRVTNPLGKLLDHIQEDVEVMRQELQQWTKSYDEASKELSKQKAANEDSLFPLTTKLKQLDSDITEKHEKINDLKITIHKNSIRIERLLANGHVQ